MPPKTAYNNSNIKFRNSKPFLFLPNYNLMQISIVFHILKVHVMIKFCTVTCSYKTFFIVRIILNSEQILRFNNSQFDILSQNGLLIPVVKWTIKPPYATSEMLISYSIFCTMCMSLPMMFNLHLFDTKTHM